MPGVHLNQVAGLLDRMVLGFADGIGAGMTGMWSQPDLPWFLKHAAAREVGQDPPDHRDGQVDAPLMQHEREIVLPPAWAFLAQGSHGPDLLRRPGRSPGTTELRRAVLERVQVLRVIAPAPPGEGAASDPEAIAGTRDRMGLGVFQEAQPDPRRPAQVGSPGQPTGLPCGIAAN